MHCTTPISVPITVDASVARISVGRWGARPGARFLIISSKATVARYAAATSSLYRLSRVVSAVIRTSPSDISTAASPESSTDDLTGRAREATSHSCITWPFPRDRPGTASMTARSSRHVCPSLESAASPHRFIPSVVCTSITASVPNDLETAISSIMTTAPPPPGVA